MERGRKRQDSLPFEREAELSLRDRDALTRVFAPGAQVSRVAFKDAEICKKERIVSPGRRRPHFYTFLHQTDTD